MTDIYNAISKGDLVLLKYMHENKKIMFTGIFCDSAVKNGDLECLKYLHENGCPWDRKNICKTATINGHLDCLKYAHENGCPYPEELLSTIVKKILISKWRDSVKSRQIVMYWMELSAQTSCAENGRARIEDEKSFENDFNSLIV